MLYLMRFELNKKLLLQFSCKWHLVTIITWNNQNNYFQTSSLSQNKNLQNQLLSMSLDLNDQQVLQVIKHLYKAMEAQQNQKLLDPDHLDTFKRREIKPLYPHKYVTEEGVRKPEKFECGEICCVLSSGSTCCACCCNIQYPDQVYQEFGLGANIYFNFMKHFSSCFIVLSILSIVSVGIAYWIALNNQINPISNYQVFFFSTTMGSFSSNYMKCRYASIAGSGSSWTSSFDLFCPQGQIHEFGPVATQNSEQSLTNCKSEREHYLSVTKDYYIDPTTYTITRDSTCNKQQCKATVTFSSQPSKTLVAFPFACLDPSYPFFANKVDIDIRILTYVFVGIDMFITLGFLFFLCSEKEGGLKEVEYFKQFQLTLKDFTVKLSGFNSRSFDQEFHNLLSTIAKRQGDFSDRIIQIKTPDDEQYLQMSQDRRQKYLQLFKFMERNFFDELININLYRNSDEFIQNVFPSVENYMAFKQEVIGLLERYRNSRQVIEKSDKDMSIYLVLNSSNDIRMLKQMRKNFCCNKYLVSDDGKEYAVEQAPIPDMLQWHNKTKWTFLRVIFSWVITLSIVLASFVLFGWIQWEQKQLLSEYNFKVDCDLFYNTATSFTTWSSTLYNASPTQYTHCYCSHYYFSLNVTDEATSRCETWWKNYLLYVIIPVIISVGLVVYNLLVSMIFKKLTQCQGHFFITNEMFSYILKRSFILIMNMGLIIVILNFNYNRDLSPKELLFLFQGQYQDITSDWYITIGSIIIMTMIFNISFPFMELIMTSVFKCFRKCVDKRCWSKKTSQKYKSEYISLYSGDVYPIEERYALIISIFWITMLFNCVIPVLNIIAALSFLLLQVIDKVLVFKFFKTPINFDQSLHKRFLKTLYISIILHMAASAFLLSEPNLVPKNSNFSGLSALSSSNQRLNTLIQTYYIIPYVGICGLLIVYGLFRETIIGVLSKCNKKIQRASMYKMRNSQSFLESLSEFQLYKLKAMTEKEVCRLQSLKRQKQRQVVMSDTFQTEHSQLFINPLRTQQQTQKQQQLQPGFQQSSQINTQILINRKTHRGILKELQKIQTRSPEGAKERKARLIGMPGYEMSASEIEAEKDKTMLELDSVLEQVVLSRKG